MYKTNLTFLPLVPLPSNYLFLRTIYGLCVLIYTYIGTETMEATTMKLAWLKTRFLQLPTRMLGDIAWIVQKIYDDLLKFSSSLNVDIVLFIHGVGLISVFCTGNPGLRCRGLAGQHSTGICGLTSLPVRLYLPNSSGFEICLNLVVTNIHRC